MTITPGNHRGRIAHHESQHASFLRQMGGEHHPHEKKRLQQMADHHKSMAEAFRKAHTGPPLSGYEYKPSK